MDRVVDFGDVDNYESIAIDQILMRWQADAWHYDKFIVVVIINLLMVQLRLMK